MNNIPHVFCITLYNSDFRIISAKSQLEKLKIKYDLFYGIDGGKTNLKVINDNDWEHTQMNNGRIGCFLSHVILWNHILYSNYDEVLILEDDFIFDVPFDKILEYKYEVPIDWDLFFVGYCCESDTKMKSISENIMTGDGICTHGYFINKKCISKLLPIIFPVDLPIDVKMRTLYNNLNVYFTKKKCIINGSLNKQYESKTSN